MSSLPHHRKRRLRSMRAQSAIVHQTLVSVRLICCGHPQRHARQARQRCRGPRLSGRDTAVLRRDDHCAACLEPGDIGRKQQRGASCSRTRIGPRCGSEGPRRIFRGGSPDERSVHDQGFEKVRLKPVVAGSLNSPTANLPPSRSTKPAFRATHRLKIATSSSRATRVDSRRAVVELDHF
jgi:hypothetical protein